MTDSIPGASELGEMLRAARVRLLSLVADLDAHQLIGPRLSIVNPPLWETGHVAWFQEHWCLRHSASGEKAPSRLELADGLYDSAAVPHATRWDLPLPDFTATRAYLDATLTDVLARLEREGATPHLAYFIQLAAFHEEMHCEALTYTRQTLAYPAPAEGAPPRQEAGACPGDVEIPGGEFAFGSRATDGFVFDNEKWAHPVKVTPFRIARAPVTNEAFAAFVEEGGYRCRSLWSEAGWRWREQARADAPVYWQRDGGMWLARSYTRLLPLVANAPVMHVNWYEAEAWCRWAKRRLPTEAEWEFAAAAAPGAAGKRRYPWGDAPPDAGRANLYGAADGCVPVGAFAGGDSAWGVRQMLGNVWEWTADWFRPYPGFERDPYKEYSEPWFKDDHKVLRGGCHATRANLIRNTWRNFYAPDRRDVFAGFRTCAP